VSANVQAIYGLTPNIGRALFPTTGLTKSDGSSGASGIGTDLAVAFTPGAFGSYVERIRWSPVASVAATATAATVLRLYISTQNSGVTTSSNTTLIAEIAAAAQTADHSTTATFFFEIPLNIKLPTATYLLISTHAAPATNTQWESVCMGMDF
jgi:hypothetical protein